jgi:hypothetical protein
MASSTRNKILVVARALDESELRCSTWRTVPENILPEFCRTRREMGSSSAEDASLPNSLSESCARDSGVNPKIAVMQSAIVQTERTSSLTVRKAAL